MMSLIKNELLMGSVLQSVVSVEARVSDILVLEATSGVMSHYKPNRAEK